MNATLIPAARMTQAHERDWRALVNSNPNLGSPFFTFEFTRAVAEARSDVFVLCIESGGCIVCFFPFHRDPNGVGRPLGLRVSDFQGLIAAPNTQWDIRALLRDAGLRVWHFNHLLASQNSFDDFVLRRTESPFLDLAQGYDSYAKARKKAGSNQLAQLERKARKIQREIGPLVFEWHTDKAEVFELLRKWKNAQRQETRTFNVLDCDWVLALLDNIRQADNPEFSGVLSALYAGDQLIAAHFGMHSKRVFHYWFPTYDNDFSRYSPGGILLNHIAKQCAELGIVRLDLGKGDERYKKSFESGGIELIAGAADSRPLHIAARRAWFRTVAWGRESPLRRQLKLPKRVFERIKAHSEMR